MIQFLHPIWLAAAAAAVVPVVLHLWNDRRGKVLRVGSVALLAAAVQQMSWRRRVSQWLLLAVRCLLLVMLALLLAGPVLRRGAAVKGWVLEAGIGGDDRAADSLVKAGWERHGFQDSVNYWAGFRAADRMAPAGVPFFVRTPGLARRFAGERPWTEREVHWEVYTPASLADSVRRWVQVAWRVAGDSVRVEEGWSRATGTLYSQRTVGGMGAGGSGGMDSVRVDTSVLRVAVFADAGYREDERYVEAAVKALQQLTRRRIEVSEGLCAGGDWLFWLSERPVSAAAYKNVFQYVAGKGRDVRTWVDDVDWLKEVSGSDATGQGFGEVLWRDGYGRVVLEKKGGKYLFYGRFNAEWNGLVWSASFPIWLEGLFFKGDTINENDRRVLDPRQIVPLSGVGVDPNVAGLRAMVEAAGRGLDAADKAEGGGFDAADRAGGGGLKDGRGGYVFSENGGAAVYLFWIVLFLFILERFLVNGKQTT